ncbi:phasin family protein [Polynucleobacter sp. CS-Odin-A6]|uniref:phasin family protein n=1 Tax=Polynucleobacter sp. CS-Odin-A6 TaxID=2689106 RepID=UPI001C0C4F34|nr:phasin family protein [Polynucleobacter sp. CS-Odin-A6]MBU3620805.1 phasin family protein [Polynucleobacter sp. CS-Odin-A6]
MDPKEIQAWQQEKAKELFDYSQKLLDAAKDLSEHHLAEIQWGMKNAMETAKSVAKNDLAKLKELQASATKEAAKRTTLYQKKVQSVLKEIGDDAADGTEKHLEKVRSSMVNWLEDAESKMPGHADKLSKVVHEMSTAGQKMFKEGRKIVNQVAETVEKNIEEHLRKSADTKKDSK